MGKETFTLTVENTKAVCAIGEMAGKRSIDEKKIPVISCEGACIRGEIARLAAHLVAKEEPYRRSCHGEMFTAPHSAIAQWMHEAEKVVVIDGCFMKCHGRILRDLIGEEKLQQFDALSLYKKYTDRMSIDDVPEVERKATAREVAVRILDSLRRGKSGLTAGGPFVKDEEGTACSPR
ncbi:MAG: putative zinc-binding protein [Syntrophaceae bacterium]